MMSDDCAGQGMLRRKRSTKCVNGKKKVTAGDSKSKGCEMWASLQALLEQYRRIAESYSRNVCGSEGSATRTGQLQRILRKIHTLGNRTAEARELSDKALLIWSKAPADSSTNFCSFLPGDTVRTSSYMAGIRGVNENVTDEPLQEVVGKAEVRRKERSQQSRQNFVQRLIDGAQGCRKRAAHCH